LPTTAPRRMARTAAARSGSRHPAGGGCPDGARGLMARPSGAHSRLSLPAGLRRDRERPRERFPATRGRGLECCGLPRGVRDLRGRGRARLLPRTSRLCGRRRRPDLRRHRRFSAQSGDVCRRFHGDLLVRGHGHRDQSRARGLLSARADHPKEGLRRSRWTGRVRS